jgi:hypothetical protein
MNRIQHVRGLLATLRCAQLAAIIFCIAAVAHAQSREAAKVSSVKLGDKVILIPDPEGSEEASSQFATIKQSLVSMESPNNDTLLVHLPVSDCERLRTGSSPKLLQYTKVAVPKNRRELTVTDEYMTGVVAAWRKKGAVAMDPDGPVTKALMERLSLRLSELTSKQIKFEINDTEILGEFDVRPDVYSTMILATYSKYKEGTQSIRTMVGSMTWLKVGPRLINVLIYRTLSSPTALNAELKPTVIELKQFTTKWVNEILAANREKQ